MKTIDRRRRVLLRGWRAWLYRGRHRSATRVGHLATGLALYAAVHLR